MTTVRPILEDDLQAYVDDELDAGRRAEVEAYLADRPDVARRVAELAAQRADLREAFGPIAEEPVPAELGIARLVADRRKVSAFPRWGSMAAAVAMLIVGAGAGWYGRGQFEPRRPVGVAALAQEASASFVTYASDHSRPVELKAGDSDGLLRWISNRLKRPVTLPDLSASGYRFMGGRVVPTPHGPAAMLMYDDDRGSRLVMLMRPMQERFVPMSDQSADGVSGFAWAQDSMGYSLTGDIAPSVLHPIANEARRQAEKI
ncbi:anti-sigma factor [Chelatococcus sambhunathii]|uniref:Anti-sigma factor n=1 Tax=Chelatococcus sambhunathii TaxID=363953 RepID=A0ABU1DDB7_9HYPH|nr:anti-sigma factor [Chelatococcus sambhunathii]MDR4305930.1 anti-sigma factor [Chelatococcus sambhunathii]